ncbi:DUF1810 domain-containing protein [Roseospirillum parvum]|uniref:Uncharacterized protein, DUF1810 family n=1 Tax=Roseospirillum parvum TaxID=83401 RepID=A0A1G7VYX5_9PROT|nr:DUF1810 domain-containing protein [Roseospirillum parvum]SDG64861.1 Uncharacterized protein, DUF1810 family [Roseospirillum parvum]
MPPPDDPLARFVAAQDGVFQNALAELKAGRKQSHWMWFVFPQLAGLGRSATSYHFGLRGLDEARAYLAHPLLGQRLRQCVAALAPHHGRPAAHIFGFPDHLKLASCLTLFEAAADSDQDRARFAAALEGLCDGQRDARTLAMIGPPGDATPEAGAARIGAVRDPSPAELVAMIRNSPHQAVRRIVCERTGAVWCWPAERASHAEGARLVGATYTQPPGGEILTLDP